MKFLKRVAVFFVTIYFCVSCDTREDYFYEQGEPPKITVLESVSTDEVGENSSGRQYVNTTLHWGDSSIISLDIQDPYGKPYSMSFEVDYVNLDNCLSEYPYVITEKYADLGKKTNYQLTDLLEITYDNHERQLKVVDKVESAEQFYQAYQKVFPNGFWNTERSEKDMVITFVINIKNSIGVCSPFYLHVNLKGNRFPMPKVSVEDGQTYMEKKIIVDADCDPDGDEVVLYEYLIDGHPLGRRGYEFEEEHPSPQSGRGGYDGTYVSTTRNCIFHAFQSLGEHVIAVRCKDRWGFWSDWEKKVVMINYIQEK